MNDAHRPSDSLAFHYGPTRSEGYYGSFCGVSSKDGECAMTTHIPWVTCEACIERLHAAGQHPDDAQFGVGA